MINTDFRSGLTNPDSRPWLGFIYWAFLNVFNNLSGSFGRIILSQGGPEGQLPGRARRQDIVGFVYLTEDTRVNASVGLFGNLIFGTPLLQVARFSRELC